MKGDQTGKLCMAHATVKKVTSYRPFGGGGCTAAEVARGRPCGGTC